MRRDTLPAGALPPLSIPVAHLGLLDHLAHTASLWSQLVKSRSRCNCPCGPSSYGDASSAKSATNGRSTNNMSAV
eukprot:12580389-Alexandrium_andersonii.AAC.1